MRCAVVVFPGTNCDVDTYRAVEHIGWAPEYVWHDCVNLNGFDVVILPGGFSYGDYITSGRLAKFSPVMNAVKDFIAQKNGFVLGICNGFQILCEAGILKGALCDNESGNFICDDAHLFFDDEKEIILPIAHKQGAYYADSLTLKALEDDDMVFLRYKNNPNGSINDIAGIFDRNNLVMGLMPHPERAILPELGLYDGKLIFNMIERELEIARSR